MNVARSLISFWKDRGSCVEIIPFDMPMGAATFHPQCFFSCLEDKPFSFAYINPCRRNADGRYGLSPNRLLIHHQLQIIISPTPLNIVDLYLESLKHIGLDEDSITFVENNWNSPSLGAQGYGWEVWANAMEITQFTYFQKIADQELKLVPVELAYGLERLVVSLESKTIFETNWDQEYSYSWRKKYEEELSQYYLVDRETKEESFHKKCESVLRLVEKNLPIAAYQEFLEANDIFNSLDAQKRISQFEIKEYINNLRSLSKNIALCRKQTQS